MSDPLSYRLLEPGEEGSVAELVSRVFQEFVAPLYSEEGVREFSDYVRPELFRRRSQADHFVLVAAVGDKLVGAIEMRECGHVSLLFVDGRFQGRGVARELLERALAICTGRNPDLAEVTVNSSPNAVPAYERLGFRPTGPEMTIHGIRFTPMVLTLPKTGHGRD